MRNRSEEEKLVKESEYQATDKGTVLENVGLAVMITRQVIWEGMVARSDGCCGRDSWQKMGWLSHPSSIFFLLNFFI
jgi:hypothetical protein